MLRKEISYVWGPEHETAFGKLKAALVAGLVLQYPDFKKPIFVSTDASVYAIGAVLEQEDPEGSGHPIAYASRTLNSAEQNYPMAEKEALAVLWSLNHWRRYLCALPCTVIVDRSPFRRH